jgi:hypothetical protein
MKDKMNSGYPFPTSILYFISVSSFASYILHLYASYKMQNGTARRFDPIQIIFFLKKMIFVYIGTYLAKETIRNS